MCYLCLKDDPFSSSPFRTKNHKLESKKDRAVEIKAFLREVEYSHEDLCHVGDVVVERLKDEQFMLAREL
jgi:hypothetical protein